MENEMIYMPKSAKRVDYMPKSAKKVSGVTNALRNTEEFLGDVFQKGGETLIPQSPIGKTAYDATINLAGGFMPGGPPGAKIITEQPQIRNVLGIGTALALEPTQTTKAIVGGYVGGKIGKQFDYENIGSLVGAMLGGVVAKKPSVKLDAKIKKGVIKSIRPSHAGIKSKGQLVKKYTKQVEGIKEIARNKDSYTFTDKFGQQQQRLPRTLSETMDALDATKKKIYSQYDALAKSTGEKVNMKDLGFKLVDEFSKKKYEAFPEIQKLSLKEGMNMSNMGKVKVTDAQAVVEMINQRLSNYFKRGAYESGRASDVDAFIGRSISNAIDDLVTKKSGGGYKDLRNKYSNLKSLESDLVKRVAVDLRKNTKGLADLSDIFTSGQIARGVMKGNPAEVASGVVGKLMSWIYKRTNSPDRIITKTFQAADKAVRQGIGTKIRESLFTGKR